MFTSWACCDIKKVLMVMAATTDPARICSLATPSAVKQIGSIKKQADTVRTQLNSEMTVLSEKIADAWIAFPCKAGETGKLYGSITPQMIADAISKKVGSVIEKRQIDVQPIRTLGEHKVAVHLTIDIVPTFNVLVHREGEKPMLDEDETGEKVSEVLPEA